jgi:hypothetical protein
VSGFEEDHFRVGDEAGGTYCKCWRHGWVSLAVKDERGGEQFSKPAQAWRQGLRPDLPSGGLT